MDFFSSSVIISLITSAPPPPSLCLFDPFQTQWLLVLREGQLLTFKTRYNRSNTSLNISQQDRENIIGSVCVYVCVCACVCSCVLCLHCSIFMYHCHLLFLSCFSNHCTSTFIYPTYFCSRCSSYGDCSVKCSILEFSLSCVIFSMFLLLLEIKNNIMQKIRDHFSFI